MQRVGLSLSHSPSNLSLVDVEDIFSEPILPKVKKSSSQKPASTVSTAPTIPTTPLDAAVSGEGVPPGWVWLPRVEKILAHRYKENGEIEYMVKFKDQSYLHVAWVGPDEFERERYSKRKVVRYHKKEEVLYDEAEEVFNPSFLEVRVSSSFLMRYSPSPSF